MQNKIRCVIVDDEPFARKGLQGYVEKIDFLELAGVCEDVLQLNTFLKQNPVDLIFLDIEMPYVSGIDFLKRNKNVPKVIFTTAYEQYALQGYELDVLDYLLKPISYERFLQSANKAFEYFQSRKESSATYLFVKTDKRLEKVNFNDILFVEAMENYIGIHTSEQRLMVLSTLKSFAEQLPGTQFIQPHKSYIVAIDKINSIEGNILHIGKHAVPLSKYLKEEVMEKIVNARLLRK